MQIAVRPLQPADVEALHSLYLRVIGSAPYGHLTEKSFSEFQSILSGNATSVSIGAWYGDRLVAYALSLPQVHDVYLGSPLMRYIQSRAELLYLGGGTVVDPEFQGRQIMIRLLRERMELLRKSEIPHFVGLAAVSNLPSLVSLLRVGHWLVGLEHDDYCQNFVTYFGTCSVGMETIDEANVAYNDLQKLRRRFESGWVVTAIKKTEQQREFILRRVPGLEGIGI